MIGKKIKILIEKSDLSVADVASKIGMTNQNLYQLFKKDSIETKHLKKIANLLGVSMDYFFKKDVWDKDYYKVNKPEAIYKKESDKIIETLEKLIVEKDKRIELLEDKLSIYEDKKSRTG